MKIKELLPRSDLHHKLADAYAQLGKLLIELSKKDLPNDIVHFINQEIDQINAIPNANWELKKRVRKTQYTILRTIEKELKLVTKNHHRNNWLAIGMAVFGIPLGVAFGTSLGNMAFIGVGIPLGMAIGMAVGASMDKKAFEAGRQLDMEIR